MILIGILLAEGEFCHASSLKSMITDNDSCIVILMIRTYAIWERRRSVLITLSIVAVVRPESPRLGCSQLTC